MNSYTGQIEGASTKHLLEQVGHISKIKLDDKNALNLLPKIVSRCLICMGVSACGKSTLGKEIASRLRWTFIEGDDFHSESAKFLIKNGPGITESQREEFVAKVIKAINQMCQSGGNFVLSWSALTEEHRVAFREANPRSMFAFSQISKELAFQRAIDRKIKNPDAPSPAIIDGQFAALQVPNYAIHVNASEPVILKADKVSQELLVRDFITTEDLI